MVNGVAFFEPNLNKIEENVENKCFQDYGVLIPWRHISLPTVYTCLSG
jgi:hypothetical protein